MSQQIQASTPSPVSPAAAPAVSSDQGSTTAYPQWVAQTSTPAVASVPTAQAPSQAAPATDPSISNQYNPSTLPSSPSNPWEAAMGSLERVLGQLPSPSQAAPSQIPAQQPVTTQQSQPSPVQPWAYQQPVQQTSPTSVSPTQTSSQDSTASSPRLSEVSAEVVRNFGIEAPAILNGYACALEDLLIQQAQKTDQAVARMGGMEQILTNPDYLADYTDRFFTEVVPVDIDGDVQTQAPQQYQQNYDMPAPPANTGGGQAINPNQQWDAFGEAMNRNPENAWRHLSQMSPEALRSKLLFMEPN